ncbi:MAG: DUF2206 domain-containing protein [Methanobacteriaceae archaeon]|nr:DUF2206 domain-containing protein [Methanobacteriaceae archaeon]
MSKVTLMIQIAFLATILLELIGLNLPILRELISTVYLIFVPGILIVMILKLNNLDTIETILLSIGLSITSIMFLGFLINFIYPLVGIIKPISFLPLLITITIFTLILWFYNLIRDNDLPNVNLTKYMLSPLSLFLCLFPFLAVFGTYMVNYYSDNLLLLALILIISLIVVLSAFKIIPKRFYPLIIFTIALSLLYHNSLISNYLNGWDIHLEYYLSNLVLNNSYWDSGIHIHYNAMLSIVILAPIMSIITGLEVTWIFKIIYPFIFAMVPLGLYKIVKSQTNEEIAFLSCFFFISLFTFYTEMVSLARQQIAELFLILILIILINRSINAFKKSIIFILFAFSIIVSHYSLSYIFMFYLAIAWFFLFITNKSTLKKINPIPVNSQLSPKQMINLDFVFLFVTFGLTWYIFVSSSYTFTAFADICKSIFNNFLTDFFNGQGLTIIKSTMPSFTHIISKYIHLISQLFILVGFVGLMLRINRMNFNREFFPFALVSLIILFSSVAVPFFASALNTSRIYHISLIFLSPFCIIGGIIILKNIKQFKLFKIKKAIKIKSFQDIKALNSKLYGITHDSLEISWDDKKTSRYLQIISIFVVIFFLFNSGFIYEIMNDHPTSYAISQNNLRSSNYVQDRGQFYICLNKFMQDEYGTGWLNEKTELGPNNRIYADRISQQLLMDYGIGDVQGSFVDLNESTIKDIAPESYIFLGYANNVGNVMRIENKFEDEKACSTDSQLYHLKDFNLIYSNGATKIFKNN